MNSGIPTGAVASAARRGRRLLSALAALLLAAALLPSLAASPAQAETLVTWTAEGVIDRVDFQLGGDGVEIGDQFSVTFTFDVDAVDTSAGDVTRGDYADLITEVQVEVGASFNASSVPADTFLDSSSVVFDDWTGPDGQDPARDQWWLQSSEGWSGDMLNGNSVRFLQRFLNLFDEDATAFGSDALPNSPPGLAPFETAEFLLTFVDDSNFPAGAIAGDVTGLAVAAADPSGTFVDDDGSEFENDIEWLAAQGITYGCNPPVNDQFCPDDPVSRDQLAAFLVRALGYVDDGGGDLFVDDDGSVFESDIDKLATAGVTFGCNPPDNDRYCPDDFVTRGQLAAFLVRALGYVDDGGGDLFVDDDGSVFESDIDKLATAGVAFGCNPPDNDRYCPDDFVTRGQLAAFLHRALG